MDRSKFVAIVTGAIAVALSLAYLVVVQLLDMRGEMVPAPMAGLFHSNRAVDIVVERSTFNRVL